MSLIQQIKELQAIRPGMSLIEARDRVFHENRLIVLNDLMHNQEEGFDVHRLINLVIQLEDDNYFFKGSIRSLEKRVAALEART